MSINKPILLVVLIYLQTIFLIYCGEHMETHPITVDAVNCYAIYNSQALE